MSSAKPAAANGLAAKARPGHPRNPIWKVLNRVVVLSGLLALLVYGFWVRPRNLATATARVHEASALGALQAGDSGAAENEWLAAITAWPQDAEAYYKLADFYTLQHQPELSAFCYQRILHIRPRYPHVYCRMALVAAEQGLDDDARASARRELKQDSRCVTAFLVLASVDQVNNHGEALKEARRAYEIAPQQESALTSYASILMTDDPAGAAAILEKAEPHFPNSARVAYELGWSYAHMAGGTDVGLKAIEQFKRAEKIAPGAGEIHREMTNALLQQNRVAEAVEEGKLAVKTGPQDARAYFAYQQALRRADRFHQQRQPPPACGRIEGGLFLGLPGNRTTSLHTSGERKLDWSLIC